MESTDRTKVLALLVLKKNISVISKNLDISLEEARGHVQDVYYAALESGVPRAHLNKCLTNKGKPWTPEDEKLLVELVNAGKSHYQISKAMLRTRKAITSHIKKMGINKPTSSTAYEIVDILLDENIHHKDVERLFKEVHKIYTDYLYCFRLPTIIAPRQELENKLRIYLFGLEKNDTFTINIEEDLYEVYSIKLVSALHKDEVKNFISRLTSSSADPDSVHTPAHEGK